MHPINERFKKNCTPNKVAVLVFVVYLITCLFIVKDYGISTDEVTERETSLVNYIHVMGKDILYPDNEVADASAASIPGLMEFDNRFYGTALQSIPVMVEHLLGFQMLSRDIYLMRHIFTFTNYFIAGIFFYFILQRRFGNAWLPVLGTLLYMLYPRFFGESFYNIKDILFYSWTIIASYFVLRWLEEGTPKFTVTAAITLAVAINTRILGVSLLLLGCVFALIVGKRHKKSILHIILKPVLLCALAFICYVAITPFLWASPFQNAYKVFSHFLYFQPWAGTHFYLGEMITRQVPWHYIPVWMGITVPLLYLVLFFTGVVAVCVGILTWIKQLRISATDELLKGGLAGTHQVKETSLPPPIHLYDLFFSILFFATLFGYIILRISMYEGWRHAYSIFFPFLYIAVFGLSRVSKFVRDTRRKFQYGLACAVTVCLICQLVWFATNHPYQYAYFNMLGKQFAEKNFTLDYWRVSYHDLICFALANDERPTLLFNGHYIANAYQLLTEDEKARVVMTNTVPADYFIQDTGRAYSSRNIPSGYAEVYAIVVDGMKISTLFQRAVPQAEFDDLAWSHVIRFEGNGKESDFAILHDENYATQWNTERKKEPGDSMVFAFDATVDYDYMSLEVVQHLSIYNYPMELSVSTSINGMDWIDMPTFSPIAGDYQMESRPAPYLYIKLENNDSMSGYWWTVGEMRFGHVK